MKTGALFEIGIQRRVTVTDHCSQPHEFYNDLMPAQTREPFVKPLHRRIPTGARESLECVLVTTREFGAKGAKVIAPRCDLGRAQGLTIPLGAKRQRDEQKEDSYSRGLHLGDCIATVADASWLQTRIKGSGLL